MNEDQIGWLRKAKSKELLFLISYAAAFYVFIIHRSILISQEHYTKVYGLRPGWFMPRYLNDVSDAQWRNFRGNIPILTVVFAIFAIVANMSRAFFHLKARGMSIVWILISLMYLLYLHGACVIYILAIASMNFLLVKIFARGRYFPFLLWFYYIFFLLCNRVYEGYPFSMFGQHLAYMDNFRGTFRWHICFNFVRHEIGALLLMNWFVTCALESTHSVVLRMISFGHDYSWAHQDSQFDYEKHIQRCHVCKSGKTCYQCLQERSLQNEKFSFSIYLCYLVFAPLYLAGPILSFKAFASQLDVPQNNLSFKDLAWYGARWIFSLLLMELMTHLFYYNAFAISGIWEHLSPVDIFIVGYGVLNFMWLKFSLLWRYFRLWSLICGIEAPENMPRCINNCYNLESFWKNWHASFNKWLVRYIYIPLGGSHKKFFNIWVVFTFVAIWHDLEWKLLSWAWLMCLFFIPEMIFKSAANAFKAKGALGDFVHRELSAVAGAVTITCLMVANLVGFVIGPSGINWLITRFLKKDGLPVLCGMFISFYIGTKLMFHIQDFKKATVEN